MFWKLQIRKTKTLTTLREKWKRHRNKKDLIRLQKLWKKRREDYERGVEEDINDVEDQMKLQERNKEVVEQLRKQRLITQTQHNEMIRREYHLLETDSLDNLEQSDILFLPSVSVPSQKDVEVTGVASGAQRIMIANYIQTVQEDRDKALQEAQSYRIAAERLKHQNRCLKNEMHSRCEVIRDF